MGSPVVLAIDIGGTKIDVARVTTDGAILDRTRRSTVGDDADALFALVEDAYRELGADHRLDLCGVGCGGPMTPGGTAVSPLNIPQWRSFALKDRLEDLIGVPAVIDNDAKAFALGEGWLGAARGARDYIALVVSTGVGGGIVVDGRLVDGATGNAGHLGHVSVVPEGRPCACGSSGCLEAEASGTAIAAMTGRPAAEADVEMRRRTGTLVGRAVAFAANLLDLRQGVVAGSVALGFGDDFFDAAREEIDRRCRIEFARGVTIEPAGLGSDGPIIGAAAVALRHEGHDIGVA